MLSTNSPYSLFTSFGMIHYVKGEVSMETTQKIGLALVCVHVAVLITIMAMHPVLSIIGISAALYMEFKN